MVDQSMSRSQVKELLQQVYFDNIDAADAEAAVQALHPDVKWVHTQVWVHDGHDRSATDTLQGRKQVLDLLSSRLDPMQDLGLRHRVEEVLVDGSRASFRARVEGPEGRSVPFLGWVELREGRIGYYLVAPERPTDN